MKKNVLITGGTGFIGKYLTRLLILNNFSVSIFSRSIKHNTADISYFRWDIANHFIEEEAVLKADYIIHLAGEGIADQRWTAKRKESIVQSREKSIQLIYDVLKKHNKKLEAFVSASGVGIYGAVNGSEICTENTLAVNDFLGSTCQKWEAAADTIASLGIRTVKIRTGLVLGKDEGFLKKLAPIFKYRLGSALGSGKQYMPWIHIDDLCSIYLEAIKNNEMSGAYNAAINDNTNNEIFSITLAKCYGYSLWLPKVPAFLIQMVLGEMALIILAGRRVSSEKIEKTGFQFQFNNLELALEDCIGK
ncbi:TIGR01777 family protein [Flavobacterium franklandianum]|uniref:TIGR01777 family protein n=1 Tax=Flavobacterium franklandianum TaxID=2594430 RepID=A0A553CR80_9FLAO|nr:TIGR01777 family oxidoreductase [Flavobacterium franklandianum]TRX23040.1 TIGR01777 family protein [Flavobacterium franklandianum]TRX27607.1 TIGR01777 family protein [Flavobacterium franklandianum]